MIILLKNENNLPVITSKVKKNVDYTDNFEFAVTTDVEIELEDVVRVRSNVVNQDYRVYEITSDGFEKRVFCKSVFFDSQDIVLDIPAVDSTDVSLWRFIARLNVYLSQKDTVFRVELDADEEKKISVEASRVTLYNLLFDEEKGLCKLYNLQVDWNDRVIYLRDHEKEGRNTEILFHENKNIASLDYNTNKKELITKLYVAATYKPSEEEKKRLKEEEKAKKEAEKANSTNGKKPLDEVARDVILGKYGNGRPRVDKLTKEGYDAKAVQKRVNELLKSGAWKNLSKEEKTTATTTEENYSTLANETTPIEQPEEEKDIIFYTVYTSPIANQYSRIYEGTLDFDSEEISSQEKLEEWCKANLFNEKDTRDVPLTTYSFTPAQEDYRVDLFDKAKVKYTRIGIDKVVKCVEFEYDPQNDKYDVINFGSLKSNPREAEMKEVQGQLSSARKENAELRQSLLISEAEFERQLELDRLAFQLDFATSKEKIVSEVEEGVQEAKDKAVEYGANLSKEIDDAVEVATRDKLRQVELNKLAIDDLNKSTNDAVRVANDAISKIDAIEIPDVNKIVDDKIAQIPQPRIETRNYALNTSKCSERTSNGILYHLSEESYKWKNGDKLLLIFDYEVSEEITSFRINRWVEFKNAKGRGQWDNTIRNNDVNTSTVKKGTYSDYFHWVQLRETVENNIEHIVLYLNVHGGRYGKVKICNLRVLKSDIPFDHRPAPEDNDGFMIDKIKEYVNDENGIISQLNEVRSKFDDQGNLKALESFKDDYEETARGTKRTLDAVKRYVGDDGKIKDTLNTHIENKTSEVFEREITKVERGIITKANIREEATGAMREYIQKVDNLKLGARNYAEDYDFSRGLWEYSQGDSSRTVRTIDNGEYIVESTSNTFHQYQIYSKTGGRANNNNSSTALAELENGKTYTLSFQAKRFTGSNAVWISLRENRKVAQGGNPERVYKYFNITNEWQTYEITTNSLVISPEFDYWRIILGYNAVGKVGFRKVELTQSSTRIDAGHAFEDLSNSFAKYKQGVDSKLSELTTATNDNKTNISTVTQTANEAKTKVTQLDGQVVKHSNITVTANGIDLGFNKKFELSEEKIANLIKVDENGTSIVVDKVLGNGKKVASTIANNGEAIKLISDNVRVTAQSEDYIRENSWRNFQKKGTAIITPFYENTGAYKLSDEDEFLLDGTVLHWEGNSASDLNILVTINGREQFKRLETFATKSMVSHTKRSVTGKLKNIGVNLDDVTKYRFALWQDNSTEYVYENLSLTKKKNANFLVDGTITGNHISSKSINSGHISTGSVTAEHIGSKAITTDKIEAGAVKGDKLTFDEAAINKLKTTKLFTDYLDARFISGDKIDGGVISAKTKIAIGRGGHISPFDTGVRFTVPDGSFVLDERSGENLYGGVGFQVSGVTKGKINKGINVYNLNYLSQPDDPHQEYGDTLLTVHGQVLAGFRFFNDEGKYYENHLGHVVCTNKTTNNPIKLLTPGTSLKPINSIQWASGAGLGNRLFFTYGDSSKDKYFINAYSAYSDERLKENINDSKVNALDFVSKLEFKEFTWRENIDEVVGIKDVAVGLIAQDVEKLDDTLVSDVNKYKELEYNRLTMYNMKATQELIEENKELKSRIARLEEIVAQLIDEK